MMNANANLKQLSREDFEKEYLAPFPDVLPVQEFPLYILAGNYREAKYLADSYALPKDQWRYVERVDDIRGVRKGSVCFYGTYYQNEAAPKIVDEINILIKHDFLVRVEISERHE